MAGFWERLGRRLPVWAAVALAAAALWFLQPIAGALVPADLGPGALHGRPLALLAAWALMILSGPLVLHAAAVRLGGGAPRAASLSALYGTYAAFCVASVLARAASPLFAAAAALLVYGQLRTLHVLEPQRAAAALGAALLACAVVPMRLARAYPRAVTAEMMKPALNALDALSWPLERQPGGEGRTDAAKEYMKADALLTGFDGGEPGLKTASELLKKNEVDEASARELDVLLARNAPALAAFRRAASLPFADFSGGAASVDYNHAFVNFFHPFRLSTAALAEARVAQARGDDALAVDDYVAALEMARHFAVQRNFRWMHMFSYRIIVQNAWPGLSALIASGKTRRGDDARLLAALRALQESKPSFAAALDDEEKRLELQTRAAGPIEAQIFRAAFRPSFLEERAAVDRRRRAALYVAGAGNRPEDTALDADAYALSASLKPQDGLFDGFALCFTRPADAGHCWGEMDAMFSPDYGGAIVYYHLAGAALSVLTAAAAARVYEDRTGRPPKRLQDLVPGELPSPPNDPFDEFKPLGYAAGPGAWRVYSLGPGRTDDGGKTPFDMTKEFSYPSWRALPKGELLISAR